MIRTVTLNTGYDELYYVSDYSEGEAGSLLAHQTVAAGKGVNAARAATELGSPTAAYGLIGDDDERRFSSLLESDQVTARLVPICEVTRHNLTIVPIDGHRTATHFRAPGYGDAPKDAVAKLIELLRKELRDDVVVLSGSSPGADLQAWLEIGRIPQEAGVHTILDIYGNGLPGILRKLTPTIAKPNTRESRVMVLDERRPIRSALQAMADCGVGLPIVTLGRAGAAFLDHDRAYLATCPELAPRVLVGAGDVFAAALAVGLDQGQTSAAELVSWATAAAGAYVANGSMKNLRTAAKQLLGNVDIRPLRVGDPIEHGQR